MNNLILNYPPADLQTAVLQKLQEAEALMEVFYSRVNPENMPSGVLMGEGGNYQFTQKALEKVQDAPQVMDGEFSLADFEKSHAYHNCFDPIKKRLEQMQNQVRFSLLVNGMDLMAQSLEIKNAFGRKAVKNLKYKSVFDELNKVYAERAEKAKQTKELNKKLKAFSQGIAPNESDK